MNLSEALSYVTKSCPKDPGTADVLLLVGFKDLQVAQTASAGSTPPSFAPFRVLREPVRDAFVLYAAANPSDILAAALSGGRIEISGGFFDADTVNLVGVAVLDGILEATYNERTIYWRLAAVYGTKQDAREGKQKLEWLEFKAKA